MNSAYSLAMSAVVQSHEQNSGIGGMRRKHQPMNGSPRCWGCLSQWQKRECRPLVQGTWRGGASPCQQLPHPFPQGLCQGWAPHGGSSDQAALCSHLLHVIGSWTEAHLCNPGEEKDLMSLMPASHRDTQTAGFGKASQSKRCRRDQLYSNAHQNGT